MAITEGTPNNDVLQGEDNAMCNERLPLSPSPFSDFGRRGARKVKVPLPLWERDLG
jgi:hypothetical protein